MSGASGTDGGAEGPDDPLASWRPGAPWPEEERTLWQERLDKAGGDEAEAERLLAAEAAEMEIGEAPLAALTAWAVIFRYRLRALGERDQDTLDALRDVAESSRLAGRRDTSLALCEYEFCRRRTVAAPGSPKIAASLFRLGRCRYSFAMPSEALPLLLEAMRLQTALHGLNSREVLATLRMIALCQWPLGDWAAALKLISDCGERRANEFGPNDPETLEALADKATFLITLGDAKQALEIALDLESSSRRVHTPTHQRILSCLNLIGRCHLNLGDPVKALPFFERAFIGRTEKLGLQHPLTANVRNNLASCLSALKRFEEAVNLYRAVLVERCRRLGRDSKPVLNTLGGLAVVYYRDLQRPKRALPLLQRVFRRLTNIAGRDRPETVLAQGWLATCLLEACQAADALPLFADALERRERLHGDLNIRTLEAIYALAQCHTALEDLPQSATYLGMLLDRLPRAPHRSRVWYSLALKAVAAVRQRCALEVGLKWRAPLRAISAAYVEDLDLTEPEAVGHVLASFVAFHAGWLDLCLSDAKAAEDIPLVLSAIQGRETAAMMLAELEAREAVYAEGDPRSRFLKVIRELRRLRMILRAQGADDAAGGDDAGPASGGSDAGGDGAAKGSRRLQANADPAAPIARGRAAHRAQVQSEHDVLLAEMHRLRADIGRDNATFRLAFARPDVSVASLAAKLAPAEALVLLFAQVSKGTTAAQHHACCVTADGTARLVPLPLLTAAHVRARFELTRADHRLAGRRGGYDLGLVGTEMDDEAAAARPAARGAGGVPGSGKPPIDMRPLSELLAEALWRPLRAALPKIRRWHIATHQTLHILPTHLGADPDHHVIAHPGLLFFWQHKNRTREPARPAAPRLLALHEDAALASTDPIPFVTAEAALVHAIWGAERVTLSTGEATRDRLNQPAPPLDAVAFVAHGEEIIGPPRQTIVHLDKAQERRLDATDVLGAAQRPYAVLISACVAGRVSEDPTGEPLGLVSAFFLKGAEFVLAPLLPISDFHAPIFMGLFHLAWRDGGDPHAAFCNARRQATTGEWPEGFADMLRAAYAPVMDKVLKRVAADPVELGRLNGWPLPADAVLDLSADACTFVAKHCAVKAGRATLVSATIDELIARRATLRPALRDILDWTAAFGA